MTQARETLVSLSDTPYYHVVSRCVRRTFLCGIDHHTGKSYEHRRKWIEDRIRLLSSIFAIDICAYAVMSNHYHVVLKICPDEADTWSEMDVLTRWTSIFKGPLLVQRFLKGDTLQAVEYEAVSNMSAVYRKRLADLSWFMKCLNQSIAREANKEDECTGHFWESRFKSQALLTEEALISCMAYVDLNPVRAGIAETPETSDHTSIKERLRPAFDLAEAVKNQIEQGVICQFNLPLKPLAAFEGGVTKQCQNGILFTLKDYLELVDYTGRAIVPNKRGYIAESLPGILQRLGLSYGHWLEQATAFEAYYEQRHSRRACRKHSSA